MAAVRIRNGRNHLQTGPGPWWVHQSGRHPLYLTFTVSLAHKYFQTLNAWEEDNRRDPYGENVEIL